MGGILASTSPWVYFALAIAVFALIIVGLSWLVVRGRGKGEGKHFDMGLAEDVDVHNQSDIWYKGQTVSGGPAVDRVFVGTPEEQSAEMIAHETTEFSDDLLDPRNPHHAEWEQREQQRIHDAQSGEGGEAAADD